MRGIRNDNQTNLFSYVQLEDRIPANHPLRKIRQRVDLVLGAMDDVLDGLYSRVGWPSIPPEHLLRASLLSADARVWDHATFSQNRDRLFTEDVARAFFVRERSLAEWGKLTRDEHFSVDGTLIDAWASHKSFVRKDDDTPPPGGRNPEVDLRGEKRSNQTHQSKTDPQSRLARKSPGDASR